MKKLMFFACVAIMATATALTSCNSTEEDVENQIEEKYDKQIDSLWGLIMELDIVTDSLGVEFDIMEASNNSSPQTLDSMRINIERQMELDNEIGILIEKSKILEKRKSLELAKMKQASRPK